MVPLNLNLASDTIHIQMRAKESGGGAADKSKLLCGIQMVIQSRKRSLFTKGLVRASSIKLIVHFLDLVRNVRY